VKWFAALDGPRVFLASPGDMGYMRTAILREFSALRQEVADDLGVLPYAWELERSATGFQDWKPAQMQIPLPSSPYCRGLICLFGERIGTPLPADFPTMEIGEEGRPTESGGPRLVHPWRPGAEGDGGFPLTGSVFEYFVAIHANKRRGNPEAGAPPICLIFVGDKKIREPGDPLNAQWGRLRLRHEAEADFNKRGEYSGFYQWVGQEYAPQLKQLKNFLAYVEACGRPVDKIVADEAAARSVARSFLIEALGYQPETEPVNPFKGLSYYDVGDAKVFFGRNEAREDALRDFNRLWDDPERLPFYGVVGGSGVGKSSLLRAGLAAHMQSSTSDGYFCSLVMTVNEMMVGLSPPEAPGPTAADPLATLFAAALAAVVPGLESAAAQARLAKYTPEAQPEAAASLLAAALDDRGDEGETWRLVVGLDQFEQLVDYRLDSDLRPRLDGLCRFFRHAAETRRIGFLFTCQTNRLDLIDRDPALNDLVDRNGFIKLGFPGRIKRIIEQSFQAAKLPLDPDFVAKLCDSIDAFAKSQTTEKGSLLPLVAAALLRVHQLKSRREAQKAKDKAAGNSSVKRNLNLAAEKAGAPLPPVAEPAAEPERPDPEEAREDEKLLEVEGAIAALAEEALSEARETPAVEWSDVAVDALLRRLVRIQRGEEERLDLRPAARPRRGGARILVQALERRRLLLPLMEERIQLVHEAVVYHWPQAAEWLEKDRALLNKAAALHPRALDWDRGGRRPETLEGIGNRDIDEAAELLHNWPDVYRISDEAPLRDEDVLQREYAFAAMETLLEPRRPIKGRQSDSCHFLEAVTYGRADLVARFLAQDPAAAAELTTTRGANAAYCAVFGSSPETMSLALAHGADPNMANEEQWRPVHVAANLGQTAMLDMLAEAGAKVDVPGPNNTGGIHLAARHGDVRMVRHLLRRYQVDPNARGNGEWTPLHFACRYAEAKTAAALLDDPRTDASPTELKGWTPFHLACRYGDGALIDVLLQHAQATLNQKTEAGWAPLHLAIFGGSVGTIDRLLSAPELDCTIQTPDKRLPLDKALNEGAYAVAARLMEDERVDPNHEDDKGATPLHRAVQAGVEAVVETLLKGGANPNAVNGSSKETPLHLAAKNGRAGMIAPLIEAGADHELRNSGGQTPLQLAVRESRFMTAKRLAACGAELDARDELGRAALHFAAAMGNAQNAAFLIDQGASTGLADAAGQTPLHNAVRHGWSETIQCLLAAGAPTASGDIYGRTPLHLAAGSSRTDLVDMLLEAKASVDAVDECGQTPLHLAAANAPVEMVALLLKAGAAPEAMDRKGWTPLHLAAQNGRLDALRALLEHGAAVDPLSQTPPLTPLQAASETGQSQAAALLIQRGADLEARNSVKPAPLALAVRFFQYETALMLLKAGADPLAGDGGVAIAECFDAHWRRRLELGDPLSSVEFRLAQRLRQAGLAIPVADAPPEEPAADTTVAAVGASVWRRRFEPLPGDEGDLAWPWEPMDAALKPWLIERINPVDGRWRIPESVTAAVCELPWYEGFRLVRLSHADWPLPRMAFFYLLSGERQLYRLNGTSPPIHEVNAKAPIRLTTDNVLDYLRFFCFFVRGEEGPFHLLETIEDPLVAEKLSPSARAVIEKTVIRAALEGRNDRGHFLCYAAVSYSDAMFLADFAIQPSGMVEMLDDEPLAAELPFRVQAPINASEIKRLLDKQVKPEEDP